LGRRRTTGAGLPDNLYQDGKGYYRYRHPVTRKYHAMGIHKNRAVSAAKKLNLLLVEHTDLVQAVLSESAESLGDCIKRYQEERQQQTGLAASTLKLENYRLNRINQDLGHLIASEITVRQCSDWLDSLQGDAYTKHRGSLIKLFSFAVAKGLATQNPAKETLPVAADTIRKKRRPLSLEQFGIIRSAAPEWLQLAMDLALVTLQRRGDLVSLQYTSIKDRQLYIVQSKTEKHGERAYLRITIGNSLAKLIDRSREMRPTSCPFILHRLPEKLTKAALRQHHGQITGDYLGKQFAKVRDSLDIFAKMNTEERPTFHEIRGLGGAEYLRQGFSKEYVNLLMGHTTQRMTDDYTGQHINWTECNADLVLKPLYIDNEKAGKAL
jgi:enterobacteria phage integrase